MALFSSSDEVTFLRELIVAQQKQIEDLCERFHALADPITQARLTFAKKQAEQQVLQPSPAETRLGLRRTSNPSMIRQQREDRPDPATTMLDPEQPSEFDDVEVAG
jgi:hypothetical protein